MNEATSLDDKFSAALRRLPLVAILRGLDPAVAVDVGRALVDVGWGLIEVPLNSPEPLRCIAALAQAFPEALVGAGTVLTPAAANAAPVEFKQTSLAARVISLGRLRDLSADRGAAGAALAVRRGQEPRGRFAPGAQRAAQGSRRGRARTGTRGRRGGSRARILGGGRRLA